MNPLRNRKSLLTGVQEQDSKSFPGPPVKPSGLMFRGGPRMKETENLTSAFIVVGPGPPAGAVKAVASAAKLRKSRGAGSEVRFCASCLNMKLTRR